jgi:hypothetical protein
MTESEMTRRLSLEPLLAAWAVELELAKGEPLRLTHKGRVWFAWLSKQFPLRHNQGAGT